MGLTSFFNCGCALLSCRLEAVRARPEDFLADLRAGFNLPESGPYRPVYKRLGSRFEPAVDAPRPEPPGQFCAEEMDFLRSRLESGLEASLGHDY